MPFLVALNRLLITLYKVVSNIEARDFTKPVHHSPSGIDIAIHRDIHAATSSTNNVACTILRSRTSPTNKTGGHHVPHVSVADSSGSCKLDGQTSPNNFTTRIRLFCAAFLTYLRDVHHHPTCPHPSDRQFVRLAADQSYELTHPYAY